MFTFNRSTNHDFLGDCGVIARNSSNQGKLRLPCVTYDSSVFNDMICIKAASRVLLRYYIGFQ